ncbi:hypothetical protein JZ751_020520 [Albula glossodonta]|uniref:Calcineurin-like phosphoesterase domain-containing protein n=1 Tax=Albula glossodonta TaxID=121402 RepID=A0A8T2PNL1_9TELE|nr:hypothetical protein JZ751_020520 [Albula glossodonta]
MAHGIPSQGKVTITVDEYSSNPTQAFTHYNINQSRFQPPHVHMVDPIPYDTPKPAGHTRFVCVSDTHSRTDGIQMPYGDVLLHMGDFTELGLPSEVKKFNDWLGGLPYEFKVVIAGNHELTFDKDFMAELVKQDYYRFPSVSKLKPEDFDNVQSLLTNCIYLQDSDVTVKGFRIYGTPCTKHSAVMLSREMSCSSLSSNGTIPEVNEQLILFKKGKKRSSMTKIIIIVQGNKIQLLVWTRSRDQKVKRNSVRKQQGKEISPRH